MIVEFTIVYIGAQAGAQPDPLMLFTDQLSVSAEWSEPASSFTPISPAADFSRLEEMWSEDTEAFVERNRARLSALAKSGSPKQQEFIWQHLLSASASS